MKRRLIKKAEFYKADYMENLIDSGEEYVEIFKNPTITELEEIKKSSKYGIRGTVDSNGTLYFWSGNILHFIALKYIEGKDFVHIEYDGSKLTFTDIGLKEDFIKQIKLAKDNFNRCGFNGNTSFVIAGYGSLGDLDNYNILNDIYDIKK